MTVLNTHHGIGVIDVGSAGDRPGLFTVAQVDELVEGIHAAAGGESHRATGAAASNLNLYQVAFTFLAARGGDEDRFLLARTGVGSDLNRP